MRAASMNQQGPVSGAPRNFWEHKTLLAVLILAAAIPLLLPANPPLTDLPGHMARYHVELNLAGSPNLQRYYDFHWGLIGNLGVDLLIVPMAGVFGLELGTKIIMIVIPMLLATGLLAVARELHGRIPPTALFALPLVYHWPFQFGFVNFSLSAALCFIAFAFWLRLGRTGRTGLRAVIFLPLACLVWVAHTYGWGLLGILAFSAETAARRDRGRPWHRALFEGALGCAPLALPFLLMVVWRSGDVAGDTGDWEINLKLTWLISILRERWKAWDIGSAALLIAMVAAAGVGLGFRLVRTVKIALPLLILLFCAIPRVLIGSGYADMRLAPMFIAVGILGISTERPFMTRHARLIAAAGLAFFVARIAVTATAFRLMDREWKAQLVALDHIDAGTRVLVLTEVPCPRTWSSDRITHISSLGVPRREIFTNGQFALPGAQLLILKYRGAPFFRGDPSHMLRPAQCGGATKVRRALAALPGHFDYLWMVGVDPVRWPRDPHLQPVWRGDDGIVYRVRGTGGPVSRTPSNG
jgi:hypothetical protein